MSTAEHYVSLRHATLIDAAEIGRLLTQLGHATTTVQVIERWPQWEADGNCALVASSDATTLIGLCMLHQTRALHRPKPIGRITALVVEENHRGDGIGRMLVAAAEDFFVRAGCGLLEVTSNLKRADAHAFYEALGYDKSSYRFVREIAK
ncbi:MAG: GNAT family N-acetyltransferase [Gemmatimonadaceae bacterium]